jgi:hypothetical protein
MAAHAKYGTWIHDDGGDVMIVHLHGRRFLTADQRWVRCTDVVAAFCPIAPPLP